MVRPNYDSNDDEKDVNGEDTALTIRGVLSDLGISRIEGSMLSLGAGDAVAELSLAKKLGIDTIKLVDNEFGDKIGGFSGDREVADIFEYLSSHMEERELVTALGMEYVLNDRSNWARFWGGVKNVTTVGSLVVVYPHGRTELRDDMFEVLEAGNVFIARRIS